MNNLASALTGIHGERVALSDVYVSAVLRDLLAEVTLSAPGIFAGFKLADGRLIEFPSRFQAPFDFRAAMSDGAISQILLAPGSDAAYFHAEMDKRGIGPAPGGDQFGPVDT